MLRVANELEALESRGRDRDTRRQKHGLSRRTRAQQEEMLNFRNLEPQDSESMAF